MHAAVLRQAGRHAHARAERFWRRGDVRVHVLRRGRWRTVPGAKRRGRRRSRCGAQPCSRRIDVLASGGAEFGQSPLHHRGSGQQGICAADGTLLPPARIRPARFHRRYGDERAHSSLRLTRHAARPGTRARRVEPDRDANCHEFRYWLAGVRRKGPPSIVDPSRARPCSIDRRACPCQPSWFELPGRVARALSGAHLLALQVPGASWMHTAPHSQGAAPTHVPAVHCLSPQHCEPGLPSPGAMRHVPATQSVGLGMVGLPQFESSLHSGHLPPSAAPPLPAVPPLPALPAVPPLPALPLLPAVPPLPAEPLLPPLPLEPPAPPLLAPLEPLDPAEPPLPPPSEDELQAAARSNAPAPTEPNQARRFIMAPSIARTLRGDDHGQVGRTPPQTPPW